MQRCLATRQSRSGSEESLIYLSKPFKSVETFSQRSDLREDPQKNIGQTHRHVQVQQDFGWLTVKLGVIIFHY